MPRSRSVLLALLESWIYLLRALVRIPGPWPLIVALYRNLSGRSNQPQEPQSLAASFLMESVGVGFALVLLARIDKIIDLPCEVAVLTTAYTSVVEFPKRIFGGASSSGPGPWMKYFVTTWHGIVPTNFVVALLFAWLLSSNADASRHRTFRMADWLGVRLRLLWGTRAWRLACLALLTLLWIAFSLQASLDSRLVLIASVYGIAVIWAIVLSPPIAALLLLAASPLLLWLILMRFAWEIASFIGFWFSPSFYSAWADFSAYTTKPMLDFILSAVVLGLAFERGLKGDYRYNFRLFQVLGGVIGMVAWEIAIPCHR